jgi:polyhydroxyalkanoate synthesis regulator phasin
MALTIVVHGDGMKKLIAVGGIVFGLGAAAFALSTVVPAGAETGVTQAVTQAAGRGEKAKGVLDGLVADGTITQDQETKILDALKAAAPQVGKGGALRARGLGVLKQALDTTAGALGMNADDLKAELKTGKSVADVATEKGVSLDDVTKALTDAANTALAQAVTDGKLTQAQADKITAHLPEAIQRIETMSPKAFRHGPMGGTGAPGDSSSSSTSS